MLKTNIEGNHITIQHSIGRLSQCNKLRKRYINSRKEKTPQKSLFAYNRKNSPYKTQKRI